MLKHSYKEFEMNRLVFQGEAPGAQPEAAADKPEGTPDAYSDPKKREALLTDAQARLDSMDSSNPDRSSLETKLTNARIAETVGTQEAQQAANDLYQALNPGVTQEVAPVMITGQAAEKIVRQAEAGQEDQTQKGLASLRGSGVAAPVHGPRITETAPETAPRTPKLNDAMRAQARNQAREPYPESGKRVEYLPGVYEVDGEDGKKVNVRVYKTGSVELT